MFLSPLGHCSSQRSHTVQCLCSCLLAVSWWEAWASQTKAAAHFLCHTVTDTCVTADRVELTSCLRIKTTVNLPFYNLVRIACLKRVVRKAEVVMFESVSDVTTWNCFLVWTILKKNPKHFAHFFYFNLIVVANNFQTHYRHLLDWSVNQNSFFSQSINHLNYICKALIHKSQCV